MKAYLAWVMVTMGLLGCGAQELHPTGGARDAGKDVRRPVIDATERNLDDASCPPEGKMTCGPYGCPGSETFATPECVHGVWSCPIVPIFGLICGDGPADAAGANRQDAGPNDAAARCAGPALDGGSYISCGCNSDTSPQPICAGGAWTCPPLSTPATICPASPPKCHGAQPAGCVCNPITGVLTCARDAGADAPSDRTGIGPG